MLMRIMECNHHSKVYHAFTSRSRFSLVMEFSFANLVLMCFNIHVVSLLISVVELLWLNARFVPAQPFSCN
jgi:hypothetical protein